jgi:hypothetical protein
VKRVRRCQHCKVDILGDWDSCPLCLNPVQTQGIEWQESPFPDVPLRFHKYLALKILIFLSVISVALSFIAYQIWPDRGIRDREKLPLYPIVPCSSTFPFLLFQHTKIHPEHKEGQLQQPAF